MENTVEPLLLSIQTRMEEIVRKIHSEDFSGYEHTCFNVCSRGWFSGGGGCAPLLKFSSTPPPRKIQKRSAQYMLVLLSAWLKENFS